MNLNLTSKITKAKKVLGNKIVFRDASEEDAEFILGLRTDSEKARYLSITENDLQKQKQWLKNYAQFEDQAYFIIESLSGEALGTVRLYDPRGNSFCWGSWMLVRGAPQFVAIESTLMVYSYAINYLGFSAAHFDVRKGNEHVWRFHERFGAIRIGENELDYFYEIKFKKILDACAKFKKYLPKNMTVIKG